MSIQLSRLKALSEEEKKKKEERKKKKCERGENGVEIEGKRGRAYERETKTERLTDKEVS